MRVWAAALVLTAAWLCGCDRKPKTEPVPPAPPQIIQDAKKVMDDAKGVGDALGKQTDDQRKQIDEATK